MMLILAKLTISKTMEVKTMVDFETIKSEEMKFGTNNFIEIARKKAVSDEGENTFVSLSRGFFAKTGEKRYRKSIALPMDSAVIDFVASKVKEMGEGATASKKKVSEEDLE